MLDYIIIAVILCIVGAIIFYLYRSKKRGETCIGCPYAKQCASAKNGQCAGSCGNSAKHK